jgi:hypothetical protein
MESQALPEVPVVAENQQFVNILENFFLRHRRQDLI